MVEITIINFLKWYCDDAQFSWAHPVYNPNVQFQCKFTILIELWFYYCFALYFNQRSNISSLHSSPRLYMVKKVHLTMYHQTVAHVQWESICFLSCGVIGRTSLVFSCRELRSQNFYVSEHLNQHNYITNFWGLPRSPYCQDPTEPQQPGVVAGPPQPSLKIQSAHHLILPANGDDGVNGENKSIGDVGNIGTYGSSSVIVTDGIIEWQCVSHISLVPLHIKSVTPELEKLVLLASLTPIASVTPMASMVPIKRIVICASRLPCC